MGAYMATRLKFVRVLEPIINLNVMRKVQDEKLIFRED